MKHDTMPNIMMVPKEIYIVFHSENANILICNDCFPYVLCTVYNTIHIIWIFCIRWIANVKKRKKANNTKYFFFQRIFKKLINIFLSWRRNDWWFYPPSLCLCLMFLDVCVLQYEAEYYICICVKRQAFPFVYVVCTYIFVYTYKRFGSRFESFDGPVYVMYNTHTHTRNGDKMEKGNVLPDGCL